MYLLQFLCNLKTDLPTGTPQLYEIYRQKARTFSQILALCTENLRKINDQFSALKRLKD